MERSKIMSEEIKLLPCPFCGSKEVALFGLDSIHCCKCGMGQHFCDSREKATRLWNTRTTPKPPTQDCIIDRFSSRTCERGTSGCDVQHDKPTQDWIEKAAEELHESGYMWSKYIPEAIKVIRRNFEGK